MRTPATVAPKTEKTIVLPSKRELLEAMKFVESWNPRGGEESTDRYSTAKATIDRANTDDYLRRKVRGSTQLSTACWR